MTGMSGDERRQTIIELAQAAVDLPLARRHVFVRSLSTDPGIVREALALAERLDPPAERSMGVGSTVSRFTLTEYLGGGGMGEVYAARDPDLERTVAIKLLNPAWHGLPGAVEKLTREARIASALNHPNIVIVHEVIRQNALVGIVMERVDGVALRTFCAAPLPLPRILSIGEQIARALAAAHSAGIVHRDIKPENIMLRADGRVTVLDFGLARPAPGSDQGSYRSVPASVPAGTWRYMSPEHCRNEPVTSATDVFALGLVLYELSTGQHPFAAESPLETMHAIAVSEPPAPSHLNPLLIPALDSAILSLLSKNPADRPGATAAAETLRRCESTGRPNSSTGRRAFAPTLATAFVIALLGFAAAVAAYLSFRKAPPSWEQLTSFLPENHATAAAISLDGGSLAYANADGIFLRVLKGGETTLLDGPRDFAVDRIAFMPDGARMIASGFSEETNRAAIWSVSATGGRARELRPGGRFGDPSPDGSRVAFLSEDYFSIWTMDADGGEPRRLIAGGPEDSFSMAVWSPNGRFLIFQRRRYRGTLDNGQVMFDRFYERSLESADSESGRVTGQLPNVWVQNAVRMPKERMLLMRGEAAGSAYENQLWETRINPATGHFEGALRRLETPERDGRGRVVGVSATADGSQIEVLRQHGQASVFVGEFDPAALRFVHTRRLTLDERSSYPHAWTADGGSVIFESNRNGSWDIFAQALGNRVPDLIAGSPKRAEVLPQLSPDGKSVLYAAGSEDGAMAHYRLMRVPAEGGPLEEVPGGDALDEFRCAPSLSGRCVIRKTIGRESFVYSELDPVRGIGRELARTGWQESLLADWDVSPDGRFVALPNHDSRSARIRVVPLAPTLAENGERTVDLQGLANISKVTWAADNKAWFVTIDTSVGRRVFHCDAEGRTHALGDINGWVVPARDGRKVAFATTLFDTNAWRFNPR